MGLSLLVSAWLFYRITGGLFNPNITLALYLVGVVNPLRFVLFFVAQLSGAIVASAILLALTPGPLSVNSFPQNGVNKVQAVFIEMFITAALALAVLMLATEKSEVTPFAPIGIGLTLFVGHLWAVSYTGGSMNTARSFGPAVITGFPYSSQWVVGKSNTPWDVPELHLPVVLGRPFPRFSAGSCFLYFAETGAL